MNAELDEKAEKCNVLAGDHEEIGYPRFEWFERDILLRILDSQWKDHLHTMDGLREGITLRGYAQKDPKVEFQREGYALFSELEDRVDRQASEILFKFVLPDPAVDIAPAPRQAAPEGMSTRPSSPGPGPAGLGAPSAGPVGGDSGQKVGKVGRNDACPCGSGKKYKKCHGS